MTPTAVLFAAFAVLTWGCYRVLSREAWWCQDRRGRVLHQVIDARLYQPTPQNRNGAPNVSTTGPTERGSIGEATPTEQA